MGFEIKIGNLVWFVTRIDIKDVCIQGFVNLSSPSVSHSSEKLVYTFS